MSTETYTIGQMCAEYGVTPRTLRFYEYKELLSPIREGQKRLFTPRCRARLKLILRGKRFGFSLDELRELLDLYELPDGQVTQLTKTLEAAHRHRQELTEQRDELERALVDLDDQIGQLEGILAQKTSQNAAE